MVNQAERESIYEQRPQYLLDRERALRQEAAPPVAVSDTEGTPVEEDIVATADEDADTWLAIRGLPTS